MRTGSFDTIIHLAAVLNTRSRQQPDEALHVNIGGSLTLLQLAAQFKVQKFIFGSSISVYGAKPFAEYGEVSEDEPAAPNTSYVCQNDMSNLSAKTIRCREHSSSWPYALQWWSALVP